MSVSDHRLVVSQTNTECSQDGGVETEVVSPLGTLIEDKDEPTAKAVTTPL